MPRTITLVPKPPKLERKKRVAAYARVSSGKDAMLHSLSAQVSHYSNLIQSRSDWEYVGVYADEAQTGTKDSRENFQLLLSECRAGNVDLVITKSISRFARNTVTLLQTVRELKSLGVDIFFEEQNIHTQSAEGELMLTILASYAQEESRSASENQKWRIKRNFEAGIPWNGVMLGYRLKDGRYEVIPEEAELVRRVYNAYLSGDGYLAIARQLNEDGVPARFSGRWNPSVIAKILGNYAYTGNLLLQKTFHENHLTKRMVLNKGQLPQYHVEDAHNAIIDIETFQAVQGERARRAARFKKRPSSRKTYPFTGLLVCENCGKNYRRKVTATGVVWICGTYNSSGKAACPSKQIPEETLQRVTAEALGQAEFSEEFLRSRIQSIRVCNGNLLIFRFLDGLEVTKIWKDRSRAESWTEEMRKIAAQRAKEQRRTAECLK